MSRPPTRSVRIPTGSRKQRARQHRDGGQPGELHRVQLELAFDGHAQHAHHQPDGEQQREGNRREHQDPVRFWLFPCWICTIPNVRDKPFPGLLAGVNSRLPIGERPGSGAIPAGNNVLNAIEEWPGTAT
jgi:hypothetical protein